MPACGGLTGKKLTKIPGTPCMPPSFVFQFFHALSWATALGPESHIPAASAAAGSTFWNFTWVHCLRFDTRKDQHDAEQFAHSRGPCGRRGNVGVPTTTFLALDAHRASADEHAGLQQELWNSHDGKKQCSR